MRLLWRRPLVSVTVVPVLPDGRILLIRRADDGHWCLPGGLLDWEEDVPHAAERELAEEAGVTIRSIRRLLGVYSDPGRDPRAHAVTVTLVAEVEGEPRITDPLEVTGIRAFSPDQLPFGHLAHDHERQLRDYLAGRTVVA